MKRNPKLYLRITIFLFIIYIGLLTVLYLSEHADSTASIRSFNDAVWYSLVTLTTVGYGDLTPVTPLGHAVGAVFLFLSAGIMMTLFGAVISFVTSEGLPFFLLGLQRRKNWYYFADYGVEASTLAKNICKEDPLAIIIFGEKKNDQMEFPDYPCLFISASPLRIVAHKKNMGAKCKIFLMKENDIGVNIRAANLHTLPVEVYARTTNGRDSLSGNISFFHSYDCCARQYWRSRPLCNSENIIVIIGFENYGRCILERAILTNIISVDQTKPTSIKAITKNPISFENSLLNPRYTPITTIAISTSDCALLKTSCINSVQNSFFISPFKFLHLSLNHFLRGSRLLFYQFLMTLGKLHII